MNISRATATNYAVNTTTQSQRSEKVAEKAEVTVDTAAQSRQAFEEYMEKTPIEHWREQILEDMGLTEDSLAALPEEEREQVEALVKQKIEQQMTQSAGLNIAA